MSKQFGAVFLPASQGGPSWSRIKNPIRQPEGTKPVQTTAFPSWPDMRNPGNTNANESAKEIMRKWDDQRTKRFEIFMEQFYRGLTPWKKEWLDRTAPDLKAQEGKILKCKIELIKRLMIIKMTGPSSLEDWILLFLYTENELDLPLNIEQLMRPTSSITRVKDFMEPPPETTYLDQMVVYPSPHMIKYPSNMYMPGFTQTVGQLNQSLYRPRVASVFTPRERDNLRDWERENWERIEERAGSFPKSSSYNMFRHLQNLGPHRPMPVQRMNVLRQIAAERDQ